MKHAWAAGFFDGEGSISIRKRQNRNARDLVIRVSQVNKLPLEQLQELFQGTICYSGTCHSWQLAGVEKVKYALTCMYPYLVLKQEQAAIALEYLARKGVCTSRALSDEEIAVRASIEKRLCDAKAIYVRPK